MDVMQTIYEKFYWPLFEGAVNGRNTVKLFRAAEKTQWSSVEELERLRLEALQALFAHADANCPFYRQRFREAGLPGAAPASMDDLAKLPVLTKDDIRRNFKAMTSRALAGSLWHKTTGGSTGQALQFAYTKESFCRRTAMSARGYAWAGARPGTRMAYLWGMPLGQRSPFAKFKEKTRHFLDRQLYLDCYDLSPESLPRFAAALNRVRPEILVGYTNPLHRLAEFVRSGNRLQFRPRGVICAAEKVHDFQRRDMEESFECPVFNTYGSREFMLIAAECDRKEGLHVSAENLIVEVLRDDGSPASEGETGRIVVTDLHNYGMPFIRYEIGDLGVFTARRCSCGRGLPMLLDITGRSLDMIRTPEGKWVPGEVFPRIFRDIPEVYRYQVVQEELDRLEIRIMPAEGFGPHIVARVEALLRPVLGVAMRMEFRVVEDIPLTPTGKYRVAVSKVTGSGRPC